MPKTALYVYDHEACAFVTVGASRRGTWLAVGAVVALVTAAAGAGVLAQAVATPVEAAQRDESDALRRQLAEANVHLARVPAEPGGLAETDRGLYRAALHARPVSDARRRRGTGGARLAALRERPAILPVRDAHLTSGYGVRFHPVLHVMRLHAGVDFGVPTGTPVYATADGRVSFVGTRSGYGTVVEIDHPRAGRMTRFAHLTAAAPGIRAGVAVRRGQAVAASGHSGLSTAPHLHYEVRQLDAARTPTNPAETFAPGVTPAEHRALLGSALLGAARSGTATLD